MSALSPESHITGYLMPGSLRRMMTLGHEGFEQVGFDVVVPAVKFGVKLNDATTNWTDKLMKAHNEVLSQGGGKVLLGPGFGFFSTMFWDPRVSVGGAGRTSTRLRLANGIAAMSASPISGRPRIPGMFYVLARLAAGGTPQIAYYPTIEDMALEGASAGQVNECSLIVFENQLNDDNVNDPGDEENGKYSAGRLVNLEISNAIGRGILVEAGRGRFFALNTKSTNNGAQGCHILANDAVLGQRCGFGGNGGHQLHVAGGSNPIIAGTNIWGNATLRSASCLGIKLQNVSCGQVIGNMMNETLLIDATTNADRAIVIAGNTVSPQSSVFVSDGVPVGNGAAPQYNCFFAVEDHQNVTIHSNAISRSQGTGAGDPTYGQLLIASKNARVSFRQTISTDPLLRQWFAAGNPCTELTGAKISEEITDLAADNCERTGANSFGIDRASGVGAVYRDPTLVANRTQIMAGPLAFRNAAGGLEGESTRIVVMTEGGTALIEAYTRRVILIGVAVTNFTLQLAAPVDAYLCREVFVKTRFVVTNLTVTPLGGAALLDAAPAGLAIADSFAYMYRPSNNVWYRID